MAAMTAEKTLTYAEAAYLMWLEWEDARLSPGAPEMMPWDEMSEPFRRLLVRGRYGSRVAV